MALAVAVICTLMVILKSNSASVLSELNRLLHKPSLGWTHKQG